MKNNLFENLPDVLDAKLFAQALYISKSGAYALMIQSTESSIRRQPKW